MKIYICTTAITRPEIHNILISSMKKYLKNHNNNITWIINIDEIPNTTTYESTKTNFENSIKEHLEMINVEFLPKNENPSFFKAVKNLLNKVDQYITNDDIVFWLEDDWKFRKTNYTINYHIPLMDANTYLTLYTRGMIGYLAPSLIGYNIFKLYLNIINNQIDDHDPENLIVEMIRKQNNTFDIIIMNHEKSILDHGFTVLNGMIKRHLTKYHKLKITSGLLTNSENCCINIFCGSLYDNLIAKYNDCQHVFVTKVESKNKYKIIIPHVWIIHDIGIKWRSDKNISKWENGTATLTTYKI